MADETPKRKEPTASEAMFFYAIVKHTRNKADIDWTAVAEEQNFKNAEVAKVRFGQVKRKLGIAGDTNTTPKKSGSASSATTSSKIRKTPTGRSGTKGKGRKAKKEANDDDEATATESSPIKGEQNIEECKLDYSALVNEDDPF